MPFPFFKKIFHNIGMGIILAIDCGTSSVRCLAFDQTKKVIHSEQLDCPLHHPQPDWVEQDASLIWQLTKQCLNQTLSALNGQHILSIGITNQRETSIVWQKSTGQPLGPAINWQCRRTAKRCDALVKKKEMIKAKTGLPLDPYFSASKFEWLLNSTSDAQTHLAHNDLCFGTVDTWLLYNLTQGKSFRTDVTNASRTMLFNIHSLTYDSELCELFQIPIEALPTVHDSNAEFGVYQFNNIEIPIHAMIGDQQAALFSQCQLGEIKNTYGTGLFMMANTGANIVRTHDLISTIAIGLKGTVSYAIEGSIFTGGALIQWLRDQLGLIETSEDSESIAQSVPNNGGVSIIPALTGLGAPHWRPNAKGLISGLTRQSTKAHIVRAALESIALQSNDIIDRIRNECPTISFKTLRVDGGASSNNWLMQLQADVSQLSVERPSLVEATAFGAAKCAATVTNHWQDVSDENVQVFLPNSKPNDLINQWNEALRFILN